MTPRPEGEHPGGEEPFEGVPPEEMDEVQEGTGELPDLEPEFMQALNNAAAEEEGEDSESVEEPAADTVEFSPREVSEAEQASAEGASESEPGEPPTDEPPKQDSEPEQPADGDGGDDKPRRTVVIGPGPQAPAAPPPVPAPPTEVHPGPAAPAPPSPPTPTATAEATVPPPPPPAVAPGTFQKPPPEGDPEPPPRRKRLWLRFLVASVLIVASMAGATAASALYFLNDIAGKLGDLKGVKKQLLPPQTGQPENILILGSDKRASEQGSKGLSDTTILLRLDPDNNAIALMSIPRDLKTYIPGVGTSKFNAAYAYGGPKLTLRIVKRITGLSINHVVNVDFLGFVRAVNAINCTYIDVDRRYYHSNLGLPPSLQYAEINIQPGYQKLCGKDALAYVRYRHTDTDLARAARQQDFLREARQQVPASDLFITKRKQLLDIFTTYTTSDISNGETLLQVLKLFVASRNAPIKEIHFPALLHPSYVTASKPAIKGAVNKFLGIEASGGPRGSLDLPTNSGNTGIVPEEKKRAQSAKKAKKGSKAPPTPTPANDGLVDSSQFSHDLAAKTAAKTLRSFPVFYPRRLPAGSIYVQQPRVYHLRDPDKNSHGAYVEVLQLSQGDYFDVQGVHGWTDPPILSNPSETRTMNGRQYQIYLDGDRVRLVSWHQGDNSYWVSNSVLQTLTNPQILGIARSVAELPGQRHPKQKNNPKR
jgi:polyisoprenyl-teichoic acid--peptidoglycan teichoic acid transferase